MSHAWHDVSPGENVPKEFNAVIEIPLGSSVEYELGKPTALVRMDRCSIRPSTTLRITASFSRRARKTVTHWTCSY
jgi:hypothetical protein